MRNFICYSKDGKQRVKILSAYHQFYAVRKAVLSTVKAAETDGRGGVFWHTQGSGKSLSMVFFAKQLQQAMSSPTIVVLTDRNDLDGQLYRQFACCRDFLRQTPVQAESRAHLRERYLFLDDAEIRGERRTAFDTTKHSRYGRRGASQSIWIGGEGPNGYGC